MWSTIYALNSAESHDWAVAVRTSKDSRLSLEGPLSVRRLFAALEAAKVGGASAVKSPSPRLRLSDIFCCLAVCCAELPLRRCWRQAVRTLSFAAVHRRVQRTLSCLTVSALWIAAAVLPHACTNWLRTVEGARI